MLLGTLMMIFIQMNGANSLFDSAGSYEIKLTLEDENGCKDSTKNSLFVKNEPFSIYLHLHPDGNGLNDDFGLKGFNIDRFKEFSMIITNRWGEIIYSVNNINQRWDGNNLSGGKAMSEHIYGLLIL